MPAAAGMPVAAEAAAAAAASVSFPAGRASCKHQQHHHTSTSHVRVQVQLNCRHHRCPTRQQYIAVATAAAAAVVQVSDELRPVNALEGTPQWCRKTAMPALHDRCCNCHAGVGPFQSPCSNAVYLQVAPMPDNCGVCESHAPTFAGTTTACPPEMLIARVVPDALACCKVKVVDLTPRCLAAGQHHTSSSGTYVGSSRVSPGSAAATSDLPHALVLLQIGHLG